MDNNYLNRVFDLSGKTVLLTGGFGRLGTAFAIGLLNAGARVIIFDKTIPERHILTSSSFRGVKVCQADITREEDIVRALRNLPPDWAIPDVLINNAGWRASPSEQQGGEAYEDADMQLWHDVLAVNLSAAALLSKIIGKQLIQNKRKGVIINIASTYGIVAPNHDIYAFRRTRNGKKYFKDVSYGVSKSGIIGLTRELAVQWAPHGIRVVALSPGGIQETEHHPDFVKAYQDRTPLGRMATPEDYIGAVIFLASDASGYMTGTNLIIDGGWTIW